MKKNNYQFIHICPDEKFIDSAISLFKEVDEGNHTFIIVSKEKSLRYIKSKNVKTLSPIKLYVHILRNRTVLRNKVIILHSSPRFSKIVTLILHKETKIVWIGFGYDYYCYKNNNSSNYIKATLNHLFLKRVDFFSPVLEEEYNIVKDFEPNFSAQLLSWNYDVISNFLKSDITINNKNILLGNSATLTNNHFDILYKLPDLNLDENRKIIIPLSYGSNEYKSQIIEYINSSSLNIIPINDFINQHEYYELLSSCSHVIMNHDRQQAYGNIMMSLFLGAKIFMKKTNPLYNNLLNKGFYIYPVDDIKNGLIDDLDETKKSENKKLMLAYFSRECFLSRTKDFIKCINLQS
ncbi:TDP-N-acetylfucosamine:lipid II N-acetylfucosaminyltransferase [Providencia vermicola]|uniref:TDP-N-acetylfucosamine:lipid II N-acetylfucosaminyltransferase n=1 Tax=Providencia vermicola TaxID=333965 RepID=UPI0034DD891D